MEQFNLAPFIKFSLLGETSGRRRKSFPKFHAWADLHKNWMEGISLVCLIPSGCLSNSLQNHFKIWHEVQFICIFILYMLCFSLVFNCLGCWEIARAGADLERGHNVSFFFCNSRAKGINGYFGWIKNPLFSSLTRIRLHTQGYFPNHWANIMLFPLMFINCFTVTPWHCFATHTTRRKITNTKVKVQREVWHCGLWKSYLDPMKI